MCGEIHEEEVQFRLGVLNCINYKIGDRIILAENDREGETIGRGTRPENGDLIGEGYVVCKKNKRDYFVDIVVENDIIVGIKYRPDELGYTKVSEKHRR
jgi:hypothetical protein